MLASRAFFHNLQCPQQKSPPPPGSPNRAPIERDALFPEPSFYYFPQFPVNGPPLPRFPNGAPMERDVRLQNLLQPIPDNSPFLQSPPKGAPPPCTPNRVPMERDTPSPEPVVYLFIYICHSPPPSPERSPPTKWGKT